VWSPDGRKRTSTRGNLEVVSQFDGFGRLSRQSTRDLTRIGTITTDYEHDAAGRVVFESYPAIGDGGSSNGLRYEYDALDRQVRTVRTTDQAFSTVDFQPPEKQVSRDFGGRTTTRSYRSYGSPSYEQLLRVDQPYTAKDENGVATARTVTTTFDPDIQGFVRSVSQGGMTRRYALDGRRLLTLEFAPELGPPPVKLGYNIGYCRDDMGQVTGKTIGGACASAATAGLVTNHYDARGRKDNVNYRDTASPDLAITYTATGRIGTAIKGAAATGYFYDSIENLKREVHRIDSQIFTLRYTYDDLSNLASITYPSGKRYTVVSDALGRVREIPGILSAVDYHATGQVRTMTFHNGQVTSLALTANNQPDTLVTQGTGKSLVSLDYGYDVVGNATSVTNLIRPEYSMSAIGYDELDRLTETRYAVSNDTYRRGYDDIGNVRFDQSPELPMLYFNYDGNNRLATLSGSLSRSLVYDPLGNLTSDGVRNMTFGYDGNLMHASTSKVAKTMAYDGRDRLLREDGPLGTVYYVYSGEHLMLEYYPAQKKYIEYLYVGPLLISSRTVEQAHLADTDGDGVNDVSEFLGLGQPAD
jgi:YD repeat-containing protein